MSLKPRHVNFDETWQKLTPTISDVVTSHPVRKAIWNETFTDVYALCVAYPEPLTTELYGAIKDFLEAHVMELYEKINQSQNLLAQYHRYWIEYSRGATYLNLLFGYLNQQYVQSSRQSMVDIKCEYSFDIIEPVLEVGELALDTWHSVMVDKIGDRLVTLLLDLIDLDRANQTVDRSMANAIIHSFVIIKQYRKKEPLKLYEELFEEKYLARSEDYYRSKANEFMESENCSLYMEKVLTLLSDEEVRSAHFLHTSSYPKVTKVCRQRMVADRMQFLHSNCQKMIEENHQTDLHHLFTILRNIPNGLTNVCDKLQKHIETTGLDMIRNLKEDSNLPASFVDCILDVHNKFSQLISECFQDDNSFKRSLQKACNAIVNHGGKKQPCRSPELVSKYCDGLLRKGLKGLTESDIDDKLKNSITVFIYIEDKDLFQKFYSKSLARRLIHGMCGSMDMEESMINRLKGVCGYEFTSKLHRMFTDIRLSSDLNSKFSSFLTTNKESININFAVNVLQAGAWPLNSIQTPFHLPEQLTKSVIMFEKFYNEKFQGRKLSWLHHLAQAEVRVQITSKTYFVTMSTYQLSVLLLFNDSTELSVSFISTSTNLGDKELEKTIGLLVDTKFLQKRETSDGVCYSVSDNFSNKRTRFKLPLAMQRDAVHEVQTTHQSIAEDRKLYLQAAIVRIMKARKTLRHNELMQEVISMSKDRFSPSVSIIKKSIESLIEKSYLQRSPNCPDEYRYLA